ncbi:oligosaccharide flippase family protein [Shewanella vesiculosa]|uniref:Oligosaccharide flippase family protein n=1 Tax=Shewanella vesiculosa TaxID=518738 RepID=A0ABV0FIU7_9GAMM
MIKNKYINNILWLMTDKIILLIGGFVVTTLVARYLGPEKLGIFSYAITLSLLCTVISQWGGNHIIFQSASKPNNRSLRIIESTILFRSLLYLVTWLLIFAFLYIKGIDKLYVVSIICLSNFFLALDLYQYYFDGVLKSKINVRISIYTKITSMILKVLLVIFEMDLIFFCIPIILEGVSIFFFKRKYALTILNEKEFNSRYLFSYVKKGIPLAISSISLFFYTKISSFLIPSIIGFNELGYFSAGITLSTVWVFIPLSVGLSLLTKSFSVSDEKVRYEGFSFSILAPTLISIPILLFIYMFSDKIVLITYGSKYKDVSEYLFYMSVTSYISVLVLIVNRQITFFKGGESFLMYKVVFSCCLASLLSYFLIKKYGLSGAILSSFIVEFLNLLVFNFLCKNYNYKLIMKNLFKIKNMFFYMRRYIK